ncbi:MAG: hypothetical protein WD342_21185 [Verrucomicrobiales bacterium]
MLSTEIRVNRRLFRVEGLTNAAPIDLVGAAFFGITFDFRSLATRLRVARPLDEPAQENGPAPGLSSVAPGRPVPHKFEKIELIPPGGCPPHVRKSRAAVQVSQGFATLSILTYNYAEFGATKT